MTRWPLRALARAAVRADARAVRAGGWALVAWRRTRRQLAAGPLGDVRVPRAPAGGATSRRAVEGVLRRVGASCLERELVRQAWFARQGDARVVVVGVTSPGEGFGAHAWLDGESCAERQNMVEILRWPPAPATTRGDGARHRSDGRRPSGGGRAAGPPRGVAEPAHEAAAAQLDQGRQHGRDGTARTHP